VRKISATRGIFLAADHFAYIRRLPSTARALSPLRPLYDILNAMAANDYYKGQQQQQYYPPGGMNTTPGRQTSHLWQPFTDQNLRLTHCFV
jgi:hypothetical protein